MHVCWVDGVNDEMKEACKRFQDLVLLLCVDVWLKSYLRWKLYGDGGVETRKKRYKFFFQWRFIGYFSNAPDWRRQLLHAWDRCSFKLSTLLDVGRGLSVHRPRTAWLRSFFPATWVMDDGIPTPPDPFHSSFLAKRIRNWGRLTSWELVVIDFQCQPRRGGVVLDGDALSRYRPP